MFMKYNRKAYFYISRIKETLVFCGVHQLAHSWLGFQMEVVSAVISLNKFLLTYCSNSPRIRDSDPLNRETLRTSVQR